MTDYTQAQLTALRAAAASGTMKVSYDGVSIDYRSLAEILKMIRIIDEALNGPAARQHYPTFSRRI